MTFDGVEGACERFEPNPFKRDVCRACILKITAHHRSAVSSEADAKAAIEWLSKRPSLVLEAGEVLVFGDGGATTRGRRGGRAADSAQPTRTAALGPLYLGGFKAAMDTRLLCELGITHVLTAARGLGDMWPQWAAACARNAEAGVVQLELPWHDTQDRFLKDQLDSRSLV